MNKLESSILKMCDWMTMKGRDHKTCAQYSREARNYHRWLQTQPPLRTVESERKIEAYLTMRAKKGCAASTQGVSFNALRMFYERGLGVELHGINALRATRLKTIRRAPSQADVRAILPLVPDLYDYPCRLIVEWIYGSGLRVSEPLNARIKDIDIEHSRFTVRDGKHGVSRVVAIPCSLMPRILAQMEIARLVQKQDALAGVPVPLPGRLALKYPRSQFSGAWAFLFPAKTTCAFKGKTMRWRIHESAIQRAFKTAVRDAGVSDDLTPHHLRHSWATHMAQSGAVTLRDIQVALGHKNLETTAGYITPELDRMPDALAMLRPENLIPFTAPLRATA